MTDLLNIDLEKLSNKMAENEKNIRLKNQKLSLKSIINFKSLFHKSKLTHLYLG